MAQLPLDTVKRYFTSKKAIKQKPRIDKKLLGCFRYLEKYKGSLALDEG